MGCWFRLCYYTKIFAIIYDETYFPLILHTKRNSTPRGPTNATNIRPQPVARLHFALLEQAARLVRQKVNSLVARLPAQPTELGSAHALDGVAALRLVDLHVARRARPVVVLDCAAINKQGGEGWGVKEWRSRFPQRSNQHSQPLGQNKRRKRDFGG
jgi:hypothetical protein